MKCKQCGWENPDNIERCEKCGYQLLRQRPFETPSAYDDKRAANNPGPNYYGNGNDSMTTPYSGRPYGDQPYRGQAYSGQAYGDQPYGTQADYDQPYGTRLNDRMPYCNDLQSTSQPSPTPDSRQREYDYTPQRQNAAGHAQPEKQEESYCPECDAPLPAGATECPVCHAVIRKEIIEELYTVCPDCGTEVVPVQKFCHNCGARLSVAINGAAPLGDNASAGADDKETASAAKTDVVAEPATPYAAQIDDVKIDDDTIPAGPLAETVPHCSLQMLASDGSETMQRIVDCAGEEVDLYRDNTDPANNTIARDLQCRLTFADGKWSIEDCSALRTTYIRPARKIELCDGDVIVMGNREFIFKL